MNQESIARIYKRFMIGLFVYAGVLFLYMIITGRLVGELYGADLLFYVSFLVMVIGGFTFVVSLIYALKEKLYPLLWISGGIVLATLINFVLVLVLAIATVW